jgi:hypothetical protein
LKYSFSQNEDEIIIETYDRNQNGTDVFKRNIIYIDKDFYKILKVEDNYCKGFKTTSKVNNNNKIIDTGHPRICFDDTPENQDLVQTSRIVEDSLYYCYSGNIYKTSKNDTEQIFSNSYLIHAKNLFLKHYNGGGNKDMKWRSGYRFPDLSKDGNKIICFDSYYKEKSVKDICKYIIEIDIETGSINPKIKVQGSKYDIISNIKYSPEDKYILFSHWSVNSFKNYIFNTQNYGLKELPSGDYLFWLEP